MSEIDVEIGNLKDRESVLGERQILDSVECIFGVWTWTYMDDPLTSQDLGEVGVESWRRVLERGGRGRESTGRLKHMSVSLRPNRTCGAVLRVAGLPASFFFGKTWFHLFQLSSFNPPNPQPPPCPCPRKRKLFQQNLS